MGFAMDYAFAFFTVVAAGIGVMAVIAVLIWLWTKAYDRFLRDSE